MQRDYDLAAIRRHFVYRDGILLWADRSAGDFATPLAMASWYSRFAGKEAFTSGEGISARPLRKDDVAAASNRLASAQ
jgi:hypothetical protein